MYIQSSAGSLDCRTRRYVCSINNKIMELIATIMIFTSARYCKSKSKNCFIYYTFMFFVITLLLSLLEHSNNTYTELTSKVVPNVVGLRFLVMKYSFKYSNILCIMNLSSSCGASGMYQSGIIKTHGNLPSISTVLILPNSQSLDSINYMILCFPSVSADTKTLPHQLSLLCSHCDTPSYVCVIL